MSSTSYYEWRAKLGGMDASMMARLKKPEDENHRLNDGRGYRLPNVIDDFNRERPNM